MKYCSRCADPNLDCEEHKSCCMPEDERIKNVIDCHWKDFRNKKSCGQPSITEEQHFKFCLKEAITSEVARAVAEKDREMSSKELNYENRLRASDKLISNMQKQLSEANYKLQVKDIGKQLADMKNK